MLTKGTYNGVSLIGVSRNPKTSKTKHLRYYTKRPWYYTKDPWYDTLSVIHVWSKHEIENITSCMLEIECSKSRKSELDSDKMNLIHHQTRSPRKSAISPPSLPRATLRSAISLSPFPRPPPKSPFFLPSLPRYPLRFLSFILQFKVSCQKTWYHN